MKHIFFIDPLEKLALSKDSTILLATTLKQRGESVYFLFEEDFFVQNKGDITYSCYDFSANINSNFYIEDFKLGHESRIVMDENIIFHMRVDPPYDSRYQRYLWMQDFLGQKGVRVVNNPLGIMKYSEKLEAYKRDNSLPSYVGASLKGAMNFVNGLKSHGEDQLIIKPPDLFQGIGVVKVGIDENLENTIKEKLVEYQGPVVIQPFEKSVSEGEIRSIYFKSKELGTILKTPKPGEYLANIAQGAKYERYEMSQELKDECEQICLALGRDGVDLIAFDILGGTISEVNVTCPGLLVEVSSAMKRNLAQDIAQEL